MKRFEELPETDRSLLREQLISGQYYLLLGSGVSLDTTGRAGPMRSANKLRADLARLTDLPESASLQQCYSLLNTNEIKSEITEHYTCTSPGATIRNIAKNPWKRVYTLNVDNALEVATEDYFKSIGIEKNATETLHFLDDYSDLNPSIYSSIIHLHGAVERADSGYVFSHPEYAKLMSRPNSWMMTLAQLIKSEPFIVAGTSLDEIDVTYYLEQRSSSRIRSDVSPSILVEPFPNRLTQRLCETHGFCLFEGTAEEFLRTAVGDGAQHGPYWEEKATVDRRLVNVDRRFQLQFAATFDLVPIRPVADKNAARFLLGSELTWGMLAARIDVPRDLSNKLRRTVIESSKTKGVRVIALVDEPGSGKTEVLKRVAFDLRQTHQNVYWFQGHSAIDEDVCAEIFEDIEGPCFIFVDNWADHQAFFRRLLSNVGKQDLVLVCAERSYRLPYIESGMADEDYHLISNRLGLNDVEARHLIVSHQENGISSLGNMSKPETNSVIKEAVGNPAAIVACRIQNNFKSFDTIVKDLLSATDEKTQKLYATAAIARYCHSTGIRTQILMAATGNSEIEAQIDDNVALPLKRSGPGNSFLVPRRPIVADRIISALRTRKKQFLVNVFIDLAVAVAPYVNRKEIKSRSPESRLAGRLLDFDQVVKSFINDSAELFYEEVKHVWDWNSRYWEQVALLRLDRYLVDQSDPALLQEAIQHARHAYAIEQHPLSLTTLAKLLFVAMPKDKASMKDVFNEAWGLIKESIDIESRWDNIRATAFIVCFNGVTSYTGQGGILDGEQANDLRDIISTTYSRKLRDRRLFDVRDEVSAIVGLGKR